jgi:hypothetical protein
MEQEETLDDTKQDVTVLLTHDEVSTEVYRTEILPDSVTGSLGCDWPCSRPRATSR